MVIFIKNKLYSISLVSFLKFKISLNTLVVIRIALK